MIKQFKNIWVFILLFGSAWFVNAQALETFTPGKMSDTTRTRTDSTTTKPKSRIHPLNTDVTSFFSQNPFSRVVFMPGYIDRTKNRRDTILYSTFLLDTSITRVNQYRFADRAEESRLIPMAQWNIGEPGSPTYNGFQNKTWKGAVRIGGNPFYSQIKPAEEMLLHRAFAPFTEFNYLQGPGKTIALKAIHTQNFSPGWNITLDYRSIINQEQYIGSGQNNQFRNIKLGSLFQSNNKKYKQIVAFSWNRSNRNENGGLKVDSVFYVPQKTDRIGLRTLGYFNPNLTTAASKFKHLDHFLKHQYFVKPYWAISQSINIQRQQFEFKDSKRDTGFYGQNYFDISNKTLDSHVWHVFTHKAGVVFLPIRESITVEVNHIFQSQGYYSKQSNFDKTDNLDPNNHSLELYVKPNWYKRTFIPTVKLQSTLKGYGKGANWIWADLPLVKKTKEIFIPNPIDSSRPNSYIDGQRVGRKEPLSGFYLNANFDHQWQPATLQQQLFFSNHFQYNRTLLFTGNQEYGLKTIYYNRRNPSKSKQAIIQQEPIFATTFELNQGQWLNPTISLDSVAVTQLQNAKYTSFNATILFNSNKFKLIQFIAYKQFKSTQINTLFNYGMPLWTNSTSIQYKTPAFHHAMDLTLGMDIQYTSKFQTTTYRPDAATFVVDSRKSESGNYFELDLYAVARVQTVDVFLKAEHINEILIIPGFNPKYQYIAGYPIQPYRIRFGINWKFYN